MSSCRRFASSEEATQDSLKWRRDGRRIQHEAQETAVATEGIEEIQAGAILTYLVYNREAASARFRFLHSSSVAVANDS